MDIWALFGDRDRPAIVSEVLAEAPTLAPASFVRCETMTQRPPDAVDFALNAQSALLDRGFTPRAAFAGALESLAFDRPSIANASGKLRPMSQKTARKIRAYAASIVIEEQS